MSQTYQSRRRMGTAPVQGNAPAQAFAPAQAAASMIGNQSMEALMTGTQANAMENGSSRLDEVMQQRVREHFLGNQIPQAEQEADRLAAQVKDAHTPEEVKSQLGDQLGADFSSVRFHTGAQAEQMADGIGARAYTAGNDVYFGQGGFDPAVAAHELVHTAQQGVVDSSVSTVAAPMGGVQMMPKFFQRIGNWFKGLFSSNKEAAKQAELKQYFPAIGAREDILRQTNDTRSQQKEAASEYARGKGTLGADADIAAASGGRQFLSLFRSGDDSYNEQLNSLWTADNGLNTDMSEEDMMNSYSAVSAPIFQQLMALDPNSLGTDEDSVRANYLTNNELVGRLNSLTDIRTAMAGHMVKRGENESKGDYDKRVAAKSESIRASMLQGIGIDPAQAKAKFGMPGVKGKAMQKAMGIQGRMDAAYNNMMNGKTDPEYGANPEYDAMMANREANKKKGFWGRLFG